MRQFAPRIAALLFAVVAVFQIAIVLGAPWGRATQGGVIDGSLPIANRVVALVSAALLITFALAILASAGIGPATRLPGLVVTVAAWITTVYAVLGIVINAASPSSLERAIWVPVAVVLAICCIATMLTTRRSR